MIDLSLIINTLPLVVLYPDFMGSLEGLSSALTISISILATFAAIAGLFGNTWDQQRRRLTRRGLLTLGLTLLIFILGVSQHFVSNELGERKSQAQIDSHRETVAKLERNARGFEALLRSNVAAQEFKELTLKLTLSPSVKRSATLPIGSSGCYLYGGNTRPC